MTTSVRNIETVAAKTNKYELQNNTDDNKSNNNRKSKLTNNLICFFKLGTNL